jgi:hypothetical protein
VVFSFRRPHYFGLTYRSFPSREPHYFLLAIIFACSDIASYSIFQSMSRTVMFTFLSLDCLYAENWLIQSANWYRTERRIPWGTVYPVLSNSIAVLQILAAALFGPRAYPVLTGQCMWHACDYEYSIHALYVLYSCVDEYHCHFLWTAKYCHGEKLNSFSISWFNSEIWNLNYSKQFIFHFWNI